MDLHSLLQPPNIPAFTAVRLPTLHSWLLNANEIKLLSTSARLPEEGVHKHSSQERSMEDDMGDMSPVVGGKGVCRLRATREQRRQA